MHKKKTLRVYRIFSLTRSFTTFLLLNFISRLKTRWVHLYSLYRQIWTSIGANCKSRNMGTVMADSIYRALLWISMTVFMDRWALQRDRAIKPGQAWYQSKFHPEVSLKVVWHYVDATLSGQASSQGVLFAIINIYAQCSPKSLESEKCNWA